MTPNWKMICLGLTAVMMISFAIGGIILWKTGTSLDDLQIDTDRSNLGWNEENVSLSKDGIRMARVNLKTGWGDLKASGGSEGLLDAKFQYNLKKLKPNLKEEVHNGSADITIRQPDLRMRIDEDLYSRWDLRLNRNIPMILIADMGIGEADLDLGGLNLSRLEIEQGMGNLHLDLGGMPVLEEMMVMMGLGDLSVDMTGDWKNDLDARIELEAGDATILLPSHSRVEVDIDTGLGDVEAVGLKREGDLYVSDAHSRLGPSNSVPTLHLYVIMGLGDLEMVVV